MTEVEVIYQEEVDKLVKECEDYTICPRCHELLTPEHREGGCFRIYIRNMAAQRVIMKRRRQL